MTPAKPASLKDLQHFITGAVSSPRAVASDPDRAADADRLLVPSPRGVRGADRLEIYREQFWLRHLANLSDDFPTLAWALGGAAPFEALAVEYVRAHPPRTWNLQRLGADLPAFVATRPEHRDDALALDACRLDWAFVEAFDAPDAAPLDLGHLAGAPEDAWPAARLVLHPSLRQVALAHPLHEVREALRRGAATEPPPAPARAPSPLVVWRDGACVLRAAAIEPAAFDLLEALGRGEPLGQACETAASTAGAGTDVGARVGEWFQAWTASGWVSAVVLPAMTP